MGGGGSRRGDYIDAPSHIYTLCFCTENIENEIHIVNMTRELELKYMPISYSQNTGPASAFLIAEIL